MDTTSDAIVTVLTAKQVTKKLVPDIFADKDLVPSAFIDKYWKLYESNFASNNNINGKVFEALIAITLVRKNILPFYMQAKVAFIPNVNYDIIIYTNNIGPISISAKTSLRERYKQADLEAVALKYIHRKAKTFLVSMDSKAMGNLKKHPDSAMGIDAFIQANTAEFDNMIDFVGKNMLGLAPKVEVVTSSVVITKDNFSSFF